MFFLVQIFESFRFAWKALRVNVLRTILSLLGVTIGIFAIISVLTIVDSLEKSVKASLNFLGSDVLYVDKFPWGGGDGSRDWWKSYIKWPTASYAEYRFLKNNLQYASAICVYANVGGGVVKRNSNSLGQVNFVGGSDDYDQVFDVKVADGRYFSELEIASGREVVIIGYEIKQKLFPNNESPIGKTIKIKNRKYTVIGTTEREGENVFGDSFGDYSCLMPYNALRKIFQTGTGRWNEFNARSVIGLRGTEADIGLASLENELRGLMRGRRGLKPTEKDNFAINRPEAIANVISGVFDVLSLAGWVIGGFSILVGGFGIANIMFVSVKERTSIIGLQKSLGAKNYFILFQFLFESVFLSLIGGLTGLLLVWLISNISIGNLEIVLSFKNVVLGLGVSTAIGVISGVVPAAMAARLDPVAAIRSN
ncbi:MAG: FtsX-like permease family protein [Cytophagia bacterium]|nr:FtsX-like permease family protein [Cytophagia bacterium]NBW33963.1 FtsX-like permease family protein [Cytophagia bacterium]